MIQIVKKTFSILSRSERRNAVLLCIVVTVSALLEALSVASILPLLALLSTPESDQSLRIANFLFDFIGIASKPDLVLYFGIAVVVFMASSAFLSLVTRRAVLKFSYERYHTLSTRLFARILQQEFTFHLNRHSAKLIDTIAIDCNAVAGIVILGMLIVFSNLAIALSLLAAAIFIHPILSMLAFFFLSTLYWLTYRWTRKRITDSGKRHSILAKRHVMNIAQAFQGIREVKVFGADNFFIDRQIRISREKTDVATQSICLAELPRKAIEAIAIIGAVSFMLIAARISENAQHYLPLTAFFAYAAYKMLPCLQQIYQNIVKIRFNSPSVYRLLDILSTVQPDPLPLATIPPRGDIKLEQVNFHYPNTLSPALDSVSIHIPVGSTVAFVGETGSGKTTAASLVIGLLQPNEGKITVGGFPIDQANRKTWQSTIGYVPQHIVLLDETIVCNIAFGVESPDMDKVVLAAKLAQLHEFIVNRLEDGYDTVIGENGVRLSGGERQRLGIARALYRSPAVLVLDEATSALDNYTEREVLDALISSELRRTVIMITHRMSALRDCNLIAYFEKGRIVDVGTFEQLLRRNSSFAALVHLPNTAAQT